MGLGPFLIHFIGLYERAAAPAEMRPILEKYGTKEKSPIKMEITKPMRDLEIKLD